MKTSEIAVGDIVTPAYLSVTVDPPRLRVEAIEKRQRSRADDRLTTMYRVVQLLADGSVLPPGPLPAERGSSMTDTWVAARDLDPYEPVAEAHQRWADGSTAVRLHLERLTAAFDHWAIELPPARFSAYTQNGQTVGLQVALTFQQANELVKALGWHIDAPGPDA
jgi:hypothetical protein